jgi:uncharacterized protein YciI
MNKHHYFVKLIPPRSTFAQDITDEEKLLMQEHVRYTHDNFTAGIVLLYGPVMATHGPFGIAVLEVADEAAARQFIESDPTVQAGLNKFELYPMRLAAARGSAKET